MRASVHREAVEQLRGVAVNQVAGATHALVSGGPAPIPLSGPLGAGSRSRPAPTCFGTSFLRASPPIVEALRSDTEALPDAIGAISI